MLEAELAKLAQVAQRADIEDQYLRVVRSQQDSDALVRDVMGDDTDARIVGEQGSQAEREQILNAGYGDGYRGTCVHGSRAARRPPGHRRYAVLG